MSQWIELSTPHGTIRAWEQLPLGTPRGALVIIQEIFGVNAHIRAVCTRASMAGYAVLAPAFFDLIAPDTELDYGPDDVARGKALVDELGLERALDVVDSAASYLSRYGKVGTSGLLLGRHRGHARRAAPGPALGQLLRCAQCTVPGCTVQGTVHLSTSACSMPPSRPMSLHCTVSSSPQCLYTCTRPTMPSTARSAGTTTPPAPTWRGNAPWLFSARN
jgi:Dienelactone hydrolase and related enzymes